MWNDLLPHRLQRVCVLLWRLPVQQHLSALSLTQALDRHLLSRWALLRDWAMGSSNSPKLPVPFPFFPMVPQALVTKCPGPHSFCRLIFLASRL